METQKPWRTGPPDADGEVAQLLEEARTLRPWTPQARTRAWQRLEEAASSPRGMRAWGMGLRLAAVAALLLVAGGLTYGALQLRTAPPSAPERLAWQEVVLGGGDVLRVEPQARHWLAEADYGQRRVRLEAGALEAQVAPRAPGQHFAVETPHARVVVVGTRFLVRVHPSHTEVTVSEGHVRVESPTGGQVLLGPGEAVRSDAPALAQAAGRAATQAPPAEAGAPLPVLPAGLSPPALVPPSPAACAGGASPQRRHACLVRLARGGGLAAQNALQTLALEAREAGAAREAVAWWQQSQARFPQGVFAPEVALGLLAAHLEAGEGEVALAQAEGFLARFPEDARAPLVQALAGQLRAAAAP